MIPKDRHTIRMKGYDYTLVGEYFVTIAAWHRESLFGQVQDGVMRLNAAGVVVEREWQRMERAFPNVQFGEFVVMPNHFHGIVVIEETPVGATQPRREETFSGKAGGHDKAEDGNDGSPSEKTLDASRPSWNTTTDPRGNRREAGEIWVGNGGSPSARDGLIDFGPWATPFALLRGCSATRPGQTNIINDKFGLPDKVPSGVDGSPSKIMLDATRPLRNIGGHPKGPAKGSLGAVMGQFKSRVTKQVWKLPEMAGAPVWQRNYYDHIIRNEQEYEAILCYIQTNPLRWQEDILWMNPAEHQREAE